MLCIHVNCDDHIAIIKNDKIIERTENRKDLTILILSFYKNNHERVSSRVYMYYLLHKFD